MKKTLSVVLNEEDLRNVNILKKSLGIKSNSQLLKYAIDSLSNSAVLNIPKSPNNLDSEKIEGVMLLNKELTVFGEDKKSFSLKNAPLGIVTEFLKLEKDEK